MESTNKPFGACLPRLATEPDATDIGCARLKAIFKESQKLLKMKTGNRMPVKEIPDMHQW